MRLRYMEGERRQPRARILSSSATLEDDFRAEKAKQAYSTDNRHMCILKDIQPCMLSVTAREVERSRQTESV